MFFYKLQQKRWFTVISVFAIFGNSIVLMLSKYPIDEEREHIIEIFNLIFFGIFVAELLIKLVGMGPVFYFQEKFNLFDTAVVLVSAIDISL